MCSRFKVFRTSKVRKIDIKWNRIESIIVLVRILMSLNVKKFERRGGKKREKKNSLCHHPYSRLILIRFDACQSGTSLNSREFRRVKKKILSPYTFLEIEIEIEMETRRKKN